MARIVMDVSGLPTYAFGSRVTPWWGTLSFCLLEGTGFALGIGGYLYLAVTNDHWTKDAVPLNLVWSALFTLILVVSALPNFLIKRAAMRESLRSVRLLLLVMSLVGLVLIGLRIMEFSTLPVGWSDNAYGSFVWLLLGLHGVHVLTDVADTLVLAVLMFTRHGTGKRFSDAEDNAFYWYFVVFSWLPLYAVLYWLPRF
ncbi:MULTISPECIES: cytochrome c oxidase subunit 3 [unclassified Mesorhizobium]|uniref:cytochrome c oxidase subunit 3 n=1 Tax=unclassified Mesorhizobium TaxID=325217 RepID=UPI000F75930E|nr:MULTISPECIES: cytochrome c oxidase subunit 3 [unclassified Mesorhizobium]AZO28727.1 cytochrome C oxidase subunit III [Mesorhizobium sp. M1B.F.Ca.ET.045.04.1.1]RWA81635.1 MAG: cytochrome C oxidase subunit III [Mesorhizobium sp.]RWB18537.1 MAG: cytochrome C oxidase subunit III [Mesorhizobium sp.]RWD99565.1 MAG: cytochrome C oxidase subunit III [Mesorhizobium sp.]